MTTVYPGAVQPFPNPGPTTYRDDPGFELDVMVSALGDTLEAVQAKLGIGSSVAAAGQVLRGTGAGASAFGAIQTADLAAGAISQRLLSPPFTGARSTPAGFVDVDSTNGKLSYTSTGGDFLVFFAGYVTNPTPSVVQRVALRLDSASEVGHISTYSFAGTGGFPMPFCCMYLFIGVAAGARVISARHTNDTAAGTMTTLGQMFGVEFKR